MEKDIEWMSEGKAYRSSSQIKAENWIRCIDFSIKLNAIGSRSWPKYIFRKHIMMSWLRFGFEWKPSHLIIAILHVPVYSVSEEKNGNKNYATIELMREVILFYFNNIKSNLLFWRVRIRNKWKSKSASRHTAYGECCAFFSFLFFSLSLDTIDVYSWNRKHVATKISNKTCLKHKYSIEWNQ